jgi:RpiR family transcriptional regulator, carbohydrate utilization regulator
MRQKRQVAQVTTLIESIREHRDSLRPAERRVADFILDAPARALDLNMAGLAAMADTSEPTVMRFCRAIGYHGFSEFKVELIRAVALGQPWAFPEIMQDEDVSDLVDKVFSHTISGLDRARGLLDKSKIAAAIDLIVDAEDLLFVGAGSSAIVALDAQQKFPLFGKACQAPLDYHLQFMAANLSSPRTVTVAVSNSGRTRTVIDVATAAKEAGGKVVSITGSESPLSRLADVDLRASTFEDTESYTPMVSRLAALVVIDILATGVAIRGGDESMERILAMKQGLVMRQR